MSGIFVAWPTRWLKESPLDFAASSFEGYIVPPACPLLAELGMSVHTQPTLTHCDAFRLMASSMTTPQKSVLIIPPRRPNNNIRTIQSQLEKWAGQGQAGRGYGIWSGYKSIFEYVLALYTFCLSVQTSFHRSEGVAGARRVRSRSSTGSQLRHSSPPD